MIKYRVILTYNLGDRRRTWSCSVMAETFAEAITEAVEIYYARERDTPKYIETVTVSVQDDPKNEPRTFKLSDIDKQ